MFCGFSRYRFPPTATLFRREGPEAFAGIVSPIVDVLLEDEISVGVDGRPDRDGLLEVTSLNAYTQFRELVAGLTDTVSGMTMGTIAVVVRVTGGS